MRLKDRFSYWQRIFLTYLGKNQSQLTFWHGTPQVNEDTPIKEIDQYYMLFLYKANYPGPFDKNKVPLLNYRGLIGKQYNPVAIAQYGLGHYNFYKKTGNEKHLKIFLRQADWLVNNLETNRHGLRVWMHHFDWEYKVKLKAPWYSALSQGQGISVLARAYLLTRDEKYLSSARLVFKSFLKETKRGGVKYQDEDGYVWLEEYIVEPPTHILNGFIWALWGVYDYYLLTRESLAKRLYDDCLETLKNNLKRYDIGFWSLYDLSQTKLRTLASPFYQKLHIIQLKTLFKLTKEPVFKKYAVKWENYQKNLFFKILALIYKIIFKIFYY
ncbi:hypothetical protein KJA15_02810 [Patescibacteria group bacterium]|nr:hypothetical protein [Patescibacteria group bacterium]